MQVYTKRRYIMWIDINIYSATARKCTIIIRRACINLKTSIINWTLCVQNSKGIYQADKSTIWAAIVQLGWTVLFDFNHTMEHFALPPGARELVRKGKTTETQNNCTRSFMNLSCVPSLTWASMFTVILTTLQTLWHTFYRQCSYFWAILGVTTSANHVTAHIHIQHSAKNQCHRCCSFKRSVKTSYWLLVPHLDKRKSMHTGTHTHTCINYCNKETVRNS